MDNSLTLHAPLDAAWTPQYVCLEIPGTAPGAPLAMTLDGVPCAFQYTGEAGSRGAEVMLQLGFDRGQTRVLTWNPATAGGSDAELGGSKLERRPLSLQEGATLGFADCLIEVPSPKVTPDGVAGPFSGIAGWPQQSVISCPEAFEAAELWQTNAGPLFNDYELCYRFADRRQYMLRLRCFRQAGIVQVSELLGVRMGGKMAWQQNPHQLCDRIISRDSFEGDNQPTVELLGETHPDDLLCRLQMPVLTEYFIPRNRGWYALFNSRDEKRGMLGILGLQGARWREPVVNMPHIYDRQSKVEWQASLESGARFWLLYAGPVQHCFQPAPLDTPLDTQVEPRLVFHRLHAEWNALRLDEHLDLGAGGCYDAGCWDRAGVLPVAFHEQGQRNAAELAPLRAVLPSAGDWSSRLGSITETNLAWLLEPRPEHAQQLKLQVEQRFRRWVHQFQGYRSEQNDYAKNVIGFSRTLRGILMAYEMLRRDGQLTNAEIGRWNDWLVFAARRITDQGRWPHQRTTLHPDHPESVRDLYTYGGEHRPDRLYWTNSLPNFQSDPLCALAHLAALMPEHPDAPAWLRLGVEDLEHQLDAYCGPSGAWEESINYTLYTLSYWIITFRALRERCGLNYFEDERVRRIASWLVRYLGPVDRRWDRVTWPAVGNAVLPTGGGEYLLCFAGQLAADDPLRGQLMAAYLALEPSCRPGEHYPTVLAALAPGLEPQHALQTRESEVMAELGVALRHHHQAPDESYLVQKIGFVKDHYEADETAFNWYAKGVPLCMDYGTYTSDAGIGGAHNVVEIPDEDSLRRGYLANHLLSPMVDYTHCEVPVTLKLLWGRVRSFAEVEGRDGVVDRTKTLYFYIGDENPVGPKVWKVRLLLFVKPDYLVLFDRVYGEVPHRFNLHFTGDELRREGNLLSATGRFGIDLLGLVQHPAEFDWETGELVPAPQRFGEGTLNPHRQHYGRVSNHQDGIYRTVLFAREPGREVQLTGYGEAGVRITTPEYTDYVFLHNDVVAHHDAKVGFTGRCGWVRQSTAGVVQAVVPDGELLEAFGHRIEGRGPWEFNQDGKGEVRPLGGVPRTFRVTASTVG